MCLIFTVTARPSDRENIERVSRQAAPDGLRIEVEHMPRWPWAREQPLRAFISEERGCACSLLSDDADWNAEVWAMRREVLERLAVTIERLVDAAPDGLIVEALWIGDVPERTIAVTAAEFGELARTSRLGTHTRYEITGGARCRASS